MVTAAARTDAEIKADVEAELAFEPSVNPSEIAVTVKDGIVTLAGWVDSYMKVVQAEEAAHRVLGVWAVANDLELRLPASGPTDADLASAAVHTLEWDADVNIDDLDVTVSNGWITLKGRVERAYQRQDAERLVRRLAGVRGVTNLLAVVPSPVPADVKARIEDALVRAASIDAGWITVEVDGSTVVLRGTVRTLSEKQDAERTAWAAPGITAVDNQLTVAPA